MSSSGRGSRLQFRAEIGLLPPPAIHGFCVNWFSKHSAIALALSIGWNFRPKAPWMAVGALGPSLFIRDFTMGHIAWGVSTVISSRASHHSSVFFRVRRLDPRFLATIFWASSCSLAIDLTQVDSCSHLKVLPYWSTACTPEQQKL
jgi:hypothetical protein